MLAVLKTQFYWYEFVDINITSFPTNPTAIIGFWHRLIICLYLQTSNQFWCDAIHQTAGAEFYYESRLLDPAPDLTGLSINQVGIQIYDRKDLPKTCFERHTYLVGQGSLLCQN